MNKVEPIRDKQKLDMVIQFLHKKNIRDYCIFVVGIHSGLFVSDLIDFEIKDVIDAKGNVRNEIKVARSSKIFEVPLNELAKAAVIEYLKERGHYSSQSEPLFISRKKKQGKPAAIQRDIVYKSINAAAREAGLIEQIGTRTMRKTYDYWIQKNEGKRKLTSKRIEELKKAAVMLKSLSNVFDPEDEEYQRLEAIHNQMDSFCSSWDLKLIDYENQGEE